MRVMRLAMLMFLLAGLGLLKPSAVLAAQRPSDMPLYAGEMDRFLSPNELQLAELQREREDLLAQRENEKNIRILKNKITILNNKIAFLQRQIKLTKPYMVTQRLVPIKAKGAQSAERLDPVQAPAPLVLAPAATATAVTEPVAVRVSLAPKALTDAAARESAVTQTLPITIAQKPFSSAANRENAAVQTLPVKLNTKSFAVTAARETAATQALPVRPAVVTAPPVEQKTGTGKTGAEWKKMTLADKEIYILSVMGNLSRRDVYLMKPYSFYIQSIDKAIETNLLLENEFIHRILMTTAYDSEPDSRKDLEKVWK